MPAANTLATFARELAIAFEPLRRSMRSLDEFRIQMLRLGWVVESLPPQYQQLAEQADEMLVAVAALGDDPTPVEVFDALVDLRDLIAAIRGLDQAPAGVDGPAFLADVSRALVELLLADYLARRAPTLQAVLTATGVVKDEVIVGMSGRPNIVRPRMHFEEIPEILADPSLVPQRVYGWGTADLDFYRIAGELVELFAALGLAPRIAQVEQDRHTGYQPDPTVVDHAMAMMLVVPLFEVPIASVPVEAGFAILELPAEVGKPAGLVVEPFVPPEVGVSFSISDTLTFTLSAGSDIAETFGLMIRPGEIEVRYPFQPGRPFPSAGFGMSLAYTPEEPRVVLGRPTGTRLIIGGATTSLSVNSGAEGLVATAAVRSEGLALVIGSADSDGFVSSILQHRETTIPLPLGIRWSTSTGLGFVGGNTLSVTVPVDVNVGPVRIPAVSVALRGGQTDSGASELTFDVGAEVSAAIGPVDVTASDVGVRLRVGLEDGSFGPFDIDLGFKPPSGVGLAISTAVATGGGFLGRDPVTGGYSGSLVLEFEKVKLSALGLLDPNAPGGYSLAAIISAQFRPIQLGLGFTLKGVGGLIGINRRVDTDALRAALRGPGIENIFFASDPVAQASRLLGDLATYFPAAPGHYVFGPAAKLGWGTPTIVEAELAVLLEMPSPVRMVLMGSLHTKLPTKDHPLIQLQVDVVGELNITEQRLAIDATLRDSFVVGFPIVGDFALRAAWGGQKQFVVSVGGFHSQFRPPPGFPTLRRVLIPIGADDDPRLDITGFLALTSNTAQVGAQIELYASAGPLNITGSVGFEALFQRSPLSFEVDLWAGVSLRRGKTVLAGVHLDGKLSGPTPWHVAGEACLSLWFVDLCVDFSATFGSSTPIELPSLSIFGVLVPLLEDAASWAESLGEGIARRVTTSPPVDVDPALAMATRLEPSAGLTMRQSVVPFNRTITRFAQSTPTDINQVVVTTATVGTSNISPVPVTDWFAPAEFEDMSDADRLSRDGFEQMDAGVSLAGDATAAGLELVVPLVYETSIIAPASPKTGPLFRPTLVAQLLSGQAGTREVTPKLVARGGLPEEKFVIASVDDLGARLDLAPAGTRGTAELALATHIAANPADVHAFVVVPTHEAA